MDHTVDFLLAKLAALGVAIGLAQLLYSDEPLTARRVVGRAIMTAGTAVGAASVLTWIPGLSSTAVIGVGAMLASLGTSGLERLFQRFLQK
jgi:hypothetical protein